MTLQVLMLYCFLAARHCGLMCMRDGRLRPPLFNLHNFRPILFIFTVLAFIFIQISSFCLMRSTRPHMRCFLLYTAIYALNLQSGTHRLKIADSSFPCNLLMYTYIVCFSIFRPPSPLSAICILLL